MTRGRGLGPDFSALLTASFVSNLGDGMRLAALPLLATTLTSSPALVSAITAAQFLPWTTFAPFGGVIVDRTDRRALIIGTQTARAAIMASLAALVVLDVTQIWHLLVVAYLITAGEILVDPSVVATVPTIVAPGDLDRANGRIATVETVTNDFTGAPLGAASFAWFPWLPFLLDALSYLGSAALFSRLPPRQTDRPRAPASLRVEMGEGTRWVFGHPFLRRLTLGIAAFHLGTAGALSLLILLVTTALEARAFVFGLALAVAAAGATCSSLVAARLTDRFSRRMVMSGGAALVAMSVLAAAATRHEWQLLVVWTANGAGAGVMNSVGRGFIQRNTPLDRLGRAAIASRMITRTSYVIGALLAGTVATTTNVRAAFVVAGLLHFVGAVVLWRSFRYEPTASPPPSP